jgi:hypothetical protein
MLNTLKCRTAGNYKGTIHRLNALNFDAGALAGVEAKFRSNHRLMTKKRIIGTLNGKISSAWPTPIGDNVQTPQ